jgi:hypothetical protein
MSVRDLISQSFVLVPAGMPAAQALALVNELAADYLIVSGPAPNEYRLLDLDQLALVRRLGGGALTELEIPRVAVLDVADVAGGPARAVVREDGALLGVWDAEGPVRDSRGRRTPRGTTSLEQVLRSPLEAAAEDPSPAPDEMHLGASFSGHVRVGEVASLLAWVGAADEDGVASMPVEVAAGETVELVVQARKGFELVDPGEGTVRAGDGEGAPFRCRLRAVEEGTGVVRIFAFHRGRPLGAVTLRPLVAAVAGGAGVERMTVPVALTGAADQALPDLSLLVMERRNGGRHELEFLVTATQAELGVYYHRFGPIPMELEPLAYFEEFFADIERAGEQGDVRPDDVETTLAAKGAHLFEHVIPTGLRERLWALRDRIVSVQVSSDEPWIPWELCRLSGLENGEWKEDGFFCERYEITRWFPDTDRRPRLTLSNLALVAPADSGLAAVADEQAYFAGLGARGVSITQVPPRLLDVQRALSAGTYDAFHFSGHGAFRGDNPDRSPIVLEHGHELNPEALSGRTRNLGQSRPIVFLNACQAGRPGMGLVDVGGWAKRFVDAGAGMFIGAYWSIYDEPASIFSGAFYDRLLAGESVGAAARAARRTIRASGDPTWLAYTVYADPRATLVPRVGSPAAAVVDTGSAD